VKVKLNSSRVGHKFDDKGRPTGVFSQAVGDIVEMPDAEARRYIERGLAAPVSENKK